MLDSARSHNNRETFGDKNSSQHLNISYHSSGFNEDVTKDSHNRSNIHSDTIGQDFWRLKRVTIPVFSGDKGVVIFFYVSHTATDPLILLRP